MKKIIIILAFVVMTGCLSMGSVPDTNYGTITEQPSKMTADTLEIKKDEIYFLPLLSYKW